MDVNSPISSRDVVGLAIYIDAIDLILDAVLTFGFVLILRNADANATGLRVICAPVASAAYSRFLDTAICNRGLIIALNTVNANHTIIKMAPLLLLSLSFEELWGV